MFILTIATISSSVEFPLDTNTMYIVHQAVAEVVQLWHYLVHYYKIVRAIWSSSIFLDKNWEATRVSTEFNPCSTNHLLSYSAALNFILDPSLYFEFWISRAIMRMRMHTYTGRRGRRIVGRAGSTARRIRVLYVILFTCISCTRACTKRIVHLSILRRVPKRTSPLEECISASVQGTA